MAAPTYPNEREARGGARTQSGAVSGGDRQPDGQSGTDVRRTADDMAEKAGRGAKEQISRRKQQATDRLSRLSGALRSTSDNLSEESEDSLAGYVDEAAGQIDRFVRYLDERSAEDLLNETRKVARRDPAMFLGGAALLGLVGARFFRSSERHSSRSSERHSSRSFERDSRPADMRTEPRLTTDTGYESHRL